jgi:hypothetical protein
VVVIVVLDTTALVADPLCQGDAWRLLAHAAPAWGVRVATTEVVLAEAIADYRRSIEYAGAALEKWSGKYGRLGLARARGAAAEEMAVAAESYPERLRGLLRAANVEILPAPDVPHMTIVGRATSRQRPCNDRGDGYRDTLNWLSFLSLAQANPDEHLTWVTDNSVDFGNEDGSGLHPDLVEELEGIGAVARVTWMRFIVDVVLNLTAENAPGSEADLKLVQRRLRDESVLEFLESDVLPAAMTRPLSARRCALPRATQAANLLDLSPARKLELEIKGIVSDEQAVAGFTVEADASIAANVGAADTSEMNVLSTDASGSTVLIEKPLLLRGLVRLGQFEKPIGGELATVEALPDDPGRMPWLAAELLRRRGLAGWLVSPDTLEAIRQAGQIRIPPDTLEAIRQAGQIRIPPDTLEAIRRLRRLFEDNHAEDADDPSDANPQKDEGEPPADSL